MRSLLQPGLVAVSDGGPEPSRSWQQVGEGHMPRCCMMMRLMLRVRSGRPVLHICSASFSERWLSMGSKLLLHRVSRSSRLIDLGRAAARFDTRSLCVLEEAVSAEEEKALVAECETVLRRRRYVNDGHWDGVIERYKEVERPAWQDENEKVLERMRRLMAAETGVSTPFLPVHIIDLAADGYIRPHVDSVKFSGELVAGLSLLSSSIMRLTAEDNPDSVIDLLLEPRSLYLLRGEARYKYSHEILPDGAVFNRSGNCVARSRRISLIFRDQLVVGQ